MNEKAVIGVTGMPGSGKDTVREVVREFGFSIVVMGDEVRTEAKRKNLNPTPENLGKIMLQIRTEEGPEVLARRCVQKIKAVSSSIIVVDGVRSMHEVHEYRKEFPNFKIIAIHASPKTRFQRLLSRNRSDDPKNWQSFVERDQRELCVGIGEVIALADFMLINEGTKEQFRMKLRHLFERGLQE